MKVTVSYQKTIVGWIYKVQMGILLMTIRNLHHCTQVAKTNCHRTNVPLQILNPIVVTGHLPDLNVTPLREPAIRRYLI